MSNWKIEVSIPAVRVRYISKNNENAQKNLQYNLCSFLSLLFYYSESLNFVYPSHKNQRKFSSFYIFTGARPCFIGGKSLPKKWDSH